LTQILIDTLSTNWSGQNSGHESITPRGGKLGGELGHASESFGRRHILRPLWIVFGAAVTRRRRVLGMFSN